MKGSWCLSWRTCVYPGEGGRRLRKKPWRRRRIRRKKRKRRSGFEARLCDIKLGERGADKGERRGAEERCTPVDWPATFNVPWTHVLMATLWLEARWALRPILPRLTTLCVPPSMIPPSNRSFASSILPLFLPRHLKHNPLSQSTYPACISRLYIYHPTRETLANTNRSNRIETKGEDKERIRKASADFDRRRLLEASRGFNAV